jgi:hypothetical protein
MPGSTPGPRLGTAATGQTTVVIAGNDGQKNNRDPRPAQGLSAAAPASNWRVNWWVFDASHGYRPDWIGRRPAGSRKKFSRRPRK